MIFFTAQLHRPATEAKSSNTEGWLFLRLPAEASAQLPARGMVSVEGSLNGTAFAATLEPDGSGSHWLKVEGNLQHSAKLKVGDIAELAIAPAQVEPEPDVPDDLRTALAAAPQAEVQWAKLTTIARRDWIQWLDSAKQVATRARRIASTIDMLLSGKRRVCCFDRSGIFSKGMAAPRAAD